MNQKTLKLMKNLTTCVVIASVIMAFLISGIRIFGVQVYGVLTGSMEPTYPTGSLIYVKDADAGDLRVNDVITFSLSPGVIATHRIVELVPDENNPSIVRYRTKGDANRDVDPSLVSASNIIGKVMFAVPGMGHFASYIQQPPGLYVAIVACIAMVAFVFYIDSLESKQKDAQNAPPKSAQNGLSDAVNKLAVKVLGKPLIKPKKAPESHNAGFAQGYAPQQPVQPQPMPQQPVQPQYGYPQQPYYPAPNQPQAFAQQPMGYAQPNPYPAQQPYYQQPAQQGYQPQSMPQQPYPMQGYAQRPVQPQPVPQQPYPAQGYAQRPMQPMPQQTYSAQPYPQQPNFSAGPAYPTPGFQQSYGQQAASNTAQPRSRMARRASQDQQ